MADLPPPKTEEPTDGEILESMRPETRAIFDKATDPKEKARMWQGAKKRLLAKRLAESPPKAHQPPDRFIEIRREPHGGHGLYLHPAPESAEDRALRKREELLKREEELQRRRESEQTKTRTQSWMEEMGFIPADELPPHAAPKFATIGESHFSEPSIWGKLWKLTESNLFWGGGVGMALAAYAFEPSAPKFSVVLLVLAWLVFTVSIFRHGFFAHSSKTAKRIYESLISILIAIVLTVTWILLRPITAHPVQVAVTTPTPTLRLESVPSPSPPRVSTPQASVLPPSVGEGATSSKPKWPLQRLRDVSLKAGVIYRLDLLMKEEGYSGPTDMAVLTIYNADDSADRVCLGTDRNLIPKTTDCIDTGTYDNFQGGEDTSLVFVRASQGGKIHIDYRPR